MARFVAKQLVKEGKAEAVMVSLTYTLGRFEPIAIDIRTSPSTSLRKGGKNLTEYVKQNFDFNLEAIVKKFDLKKPRYRAISVYGQFGWEGLPWE
jgi:S-adenosylmethionine synthetase